MASWSPQTAMVLGAGLGQRMRPLTNDIPKPLVKLQGKPLIDYALERLADVGVKRVVVNTHYHADKLEDHLRKHTRSEITISDEREQLLDTGGGVKKALPLLGDEPFFIHNSDSLWIESSGSNLERMVTLWKSEDMDCLLLLAITAASIGYNGAGDFAMAPNGVLRRRQKNEVVPFVFTGVSLIHPRLFHESPEGPFSLNLLWDRALEAGRLYGLRHEGVLMHVGTPQALAEAEEYLISGS